VQAFYETIGPLSEDEKDVRCEMSDAIKEDEVWGEVEGIADLLV
jgi:hypothetical protein